MTKDRLNGFLYGEPVRVLLEAPYGQQDDLFHSGQHAPLFGTRCYLLRLVRQITYRSLHRGQSASGENMENHCEG